MSEVNVSRNGDYYIFDIDRSGGVGALSCTHETCVCYNTKTKKWTGDEINSSGWIDLEEGELDVIVKHYDLESYIKEK